MPYWRKLILAGIQQLAVLAWGAAHEPFELRSADGRVAYMSRKAELQAHELARAGARLAQILNATLGTPPT